MAQFDEGFDYEFLYEVGSLKGYRLYVDDSEAADKYNDTNIKVCIHNEHSTKFNIVQTSDGSYKIKVADGRYQGWELSYSTHEKNKNVFYLTVTNGNYFQNYWYFDQIKGVAWDRWKVIIRSKYNQFYVASSGGGWKRNNFSFFAFTQKGNRVGDFWSSFRVQITGGTSTLQAKVTTLQNSLAQQKTTKDKYYQNWCASWTESENLKKQLTTTRQNYQTQINSIQAKVQDISKSNNALKAEVSKLTEVKRIYESLVAQNKVTIQSLQEANQLLENEKKLLSEMRGDTEQQNSAHLEQIKMLQQEIARLQENSMNNSKQSGISSEHLEIILKKYEQFVAERANEKQVIQKKWQELMAKQSTMMEYARNIVDDRKRVTQLELKLAQKDEETSQLKDLIQRMERKNMQLQQQVNGLSQQTAEKINNLTAQSKTQSDINSRLTQKLAEVKKKLIKIGQKSTYFKYLYEDLLKNKGSYKNQQEIQNKGEQAMKNVFDSLNRIEYLRNLLAANNIEVDNEAPQNQNQEKEQQQMQEQHQGQQQQQQKNEQINEESEKEEDPQNLKGKARVVNKLMKLSAAEIQLLNIDQLDKQFQTYFAQKSKQNEKKECRAVAKRAKTLVPGQFDLKLSNNQLTIDKNIVSSADVADDKPRLAFLNQYLQESGQMTVKFTKIQGVVALGIYNVKNVLQENPQSIGSFDPQQHIYSLLSNDGRLAHNDGIIPAKQTTYLSFQQGDTISLSFDSLTKIVSLQVVNSYKYASYKIHFWQDNAFRPAFLLKGKNNIIQVVKKNKQGSDPQASSSQPSSSYPGGYYFDPVSYSNYNYASYGQASSQPQSMSMGGMHNMTMGSNQETSNNNGNEFSRRNNDIICRKDHIMSKQFQSAEQYMKHTCSVCFHFTSMKGNERYQCSQSQCSDVLCYQCKNSKYGYGFPM